MQKKQGNIKVFCRFRPFNQKELLLQAQTLHRIANKTQLIIKDNKQEKTDEISFMYDQIFNIDSTQQEVFEQVGYPVLKNILDGFNGTIMAYGQTSSGKTYTMQGYDMNDKQIKGIMPRIIQKLFSAIQKSTDSIEFKLKISIFEIYMEKIRDLLDISKKDLKIRSNKQGPYVENLTQVYIGDKNELFKLIQFGQKNRVTCSTNMNQHSSRSHMIFLLSVNQFNNSDSSSKTSKLFLIDLAGSEKASKTGASGKVLQQAKKINLSLTNLGKVIKTLAEKNGHIPYRDSKLTRVLQDSLGGNSKTTLIVTCSPHVIHLPETLSTLRFGENAQKIKNKPKIIRLLTVQELQKMIQKLQKQMQHKNNKINFLQDYIKLTLKAQLPMINKLILQSHNNNQIQENEQILKKYQQCHDNNSELSTENKEQENDQFNQQDEQRITALQQQLSAYQLKIDNQNQKYYTLKKEYTELHQNLKSILTENIALQEQKTLIQKEKNKLNQELLNSLADLNILRKQNSHQNKSGRKKSVSKQKEENLQNQLIKENASLIKMIVGELFQIIGPYQEQEIIKIIQNNHWYKTIMEEKQSCIDFFQYQRDKLKSQVEEFLKQKNSESSKNQGSEIEKLKNEIKKQKKQHNERIVILENKLDKLFDEYHQMIALQTSWKAQCQLYQRKLRRKQEKILELQQMLQQLEEQIKYLGINQYSDFDDSQSVKSKIVKPLKGGFLFK